MTCFIPFIIFTNNKESKIIPYPESSDLVDEILEPNENNSFEFIYKKLNTYAIGHGTSQIGDILNRSDLNVANWQKGGDNKQEAQTASANYTGQAQTQRSGSGKRSSGKLTSDNKKSGKGKRALTIQK